MEPPREVNVLLPPARFVILLAAGLLLCAPACSARQGEEEPQGQGHTSTALHPVTLVEVEFLDGQTRLAGTGRSGGNALFQSRRDRAREGLAAVRFLRSFDGIDPERVGICGGSEGAGVALLAAGMDPDIAFAIAISGAFGMSSMDISRYRIEAMGLRRGLSDDAVQKALVLEEILYALVTGLDVVEWRLLRLRASSWESEQWGELIELVERSRPELSEAEKDTMWSSLRRILRDWMTERWFDLAVVDRANLERFLAMDTQTFFGFLAREPLAAGDWYRGREELELLANVGCPVLAVWGEEDDFLPPRRSAAWLGANLSEAGNTDVTLRILPDAGHLITLVDDPDRYAPGYPQLLGEWLRQRGPRVVR